MPPIVRVGVWEQGQYIGCVLFARGANKNIGAPYGLDALSVCELVRVALRSHESPVSRVVAIAMRFLRKHSPGLRLIVSYADPSEGHHGGIYQAGGWLYCGMSKGGKEWFHDGRWKHSREATSGAFGNTRSISDLSAVPSRMTSGKHKYLMPLDDEMRARIASLAKPYPKRV